MPLCIVPAVPRGDPPFDFLRAFGEPGTLLLKSCPFSRLLAQRAFPPARLTRLFPQHVARFLGLGHRRRRIRQLLDPLLEVFAVFDDRLHLAVEHAEHRGVLGAERSTTGRAFPFRAESLVFVMLILFFVVLCKMFCATVYTLLLL